MGFFEFFGYVKVKSSTTEGLYNSYAYSPGFGRIVATHTKSEPNPIRTVDDVLDSFDFQPGE